MLTGKAVGGPLHGVKLSGPKHWDGLIKIPGQQSNTARPEYHHGHYEWWGNVWRWKSHAPEPLPRYR